MDSTGTGSSNLDLIARFFENCPDLTVDSKTVKLSLVLGGSAPGGVPGPGGCLVETPPGRLLLRAVRILLECILIENENTWFKRHQYPGGYDGLMGR